MIVKQLSPKKKDKKRIKRILFAIYILRLRKFLSLRADILKRKIKKNNVEIFRVTSGKKRTENALKALKNSLYYIKQKFTIKNRLSCKYCDFYKREHCR